MSGHREYCSRKWLQAHGVNQRSELRSEYEKGAYDQFMATVFADADRFGWT